jgi:cysteine sulfinate desulfinase/cysteine desulfurase-like protein
MTADATIAFVAFLFTCGGRPDLQSGGARVLGVVGVTAATAARTFELAGWIKRIVEYRHGHCPQLQLLPRHSLHFSCRAA